MAQIAQEEAEMRKTPVMNKHSQVCFYVWSSASAKQKQEAEAGSRQWRRASGFCGQASRGVLFACVFA